MRRITLLLFTLMLVPACAGFSGPAKPALFGAGELHVYLDRFPVDAARLSCGIKRISAISTGGEEFQLTPVQYKWNAGENARQRLIALGQVPPGAYAGLTLEVETAALAGEQGEALLLAPEFPVIIDYSYSVREGRAVVLSLLLAYEESVHTGYRFTPVLAASMPGLPPSSLLGYVVNHGDNSVTAFNKRSGAAVAVIATGRMPFGIALDRASERLYVSLSGEDAIDVMDIREGGPVNRINLNTGDAPADIALTPDGERLLSLNPGSATLSIIDPRMFSEESRVVVGDGPRSILVDQSGERCYVFNGRSHTVTVVDIPSASVIAALATEAGPSRGQLNRKGDKLYVIHGESPYLLVFDTRSLSLQSRVFVGPGLSAIKVDPATDRLYAYRLHETRIEVYDPFSLLPADYLAAPAGIVDFALDAETNRLYLLSAERNTVTAVDLISRKKVSETDLGRNPSRIVLMGER